MNLYIVILDQIRKRVGPATSCALFLCLGAAATRASGASDDLQVNTLSSRRDMVSAGDALVQIIGPSDLISNQMSVTLNGRDITKAFRPSPITHTLIGLVDGLRVGKNTLEVRAKSKLKAALELMNHPATGPVFSGPHQTPFACQTDAAGLGPALDADCSANPMVTYAYKSTQPPSKADVEAAQKPSAFPLGFKPFDPGAPRPPDLAKVTMSDGRELAYIVRRERGTINRAIYEIAFLHEPRKPLPDPWTQAPGWNGRLVYVFGGGAKAGYHQGLPLASAVDDVALSRGYAVAASSLNILGNTSDDVISAETLMMVKEHFIKRYGVPVRTIGWGGSGGSIQQHLIAQNYPGLLDGIISGASYPDLTTVVPGVVDCSLLAHAFETAKHHWTDEQKTAVSGFASWGTCAKESNGGGWIKWGFSPGLIQPTACDASVPHALIYDARANPKGARCDVYNNQITVYGRDPGTGFARRPLDNVGVQYGLVAFNSGKITGEQFVELNENVGGYDIDGNIVPSRTVADPHALGTAYETGRVNTGGGGLGLVPIIDIRPYIDTLPDIHDQFRSFATRARLMAANGRADNQVILTVSVGANPTQNSLGQAAVFVQQLLATLPLMDQWLDNIAGDHSQAVLAEKIASNRPPQLADACWTEKGEKIAEQRTYDGNGRCNQLFPPHGDPRIAAGGPLADNVLKCALKPVDPKDYVHPLTEDLLARLKAIFPQGVCDYSRPGVGAQMVRGTWREY